MLEKFEIFGSDVRGNHRLNLKLFRRQQPCADSTMIMRVLHRIENPVLWQGAGLQDTRRLVMLKIAAVV